ncbi:uncharacterized protein [Spinacia oleracea]|uniref:Reverse transcriptase domain-containing protein n=1 Tax=Spinacia oleracea TaxID=3562 RepID=A0A9R0IAE1_SPIOL|nr:uncharacterized protein LOC110785452 [Spinacia oleracea]
MAMNHLCFADDLLMFCRGDLNSVKLMLEGFKVFSEATGLQVNPTKSSIYCCGMSSSIQTSIQQCSGFKLDFLPFRYLGVPISSKKLKASDCDLLVEKMVAKIKVWSSRHISFAGRMQLVNSVLMSICVYWGQIFLLPKRITQKITAICRSFLWFGTYDESRPGSVGWDQLCNHKDQGGLGFRNISLWNQAAVGKLAWAISENSITEALASTQWLTDPKYSIKNIYGGLCTQQPKVHWHRFVWNRFSVPKHRFTLWLALLDRLKTRVRLFKIGVGDDPSCAICGSVVETCSHLFFECTFSTDCLQLVLNWLGYTVTKTNLTQVFMWVRRYCKKEFRRKVIFTALAGLVYQIWKARNDVVWNHNVPTKQFILKTIQFDTRHRIQNLLGKTVRL